MKKTRILTRLYGVTPMIVLRRNLFKARHVTQQDYINHTQDHGFVGYPFDYRVTLGFGSIAGGLDHVNPIIRLPLERGISKTQYYYVCSRSLILDPLNDRWIDSLQELSTLGTSLKKPLSKGTNSWAPTQALTTIQTMDDHSQNWHDRTSSRNVSNSNNTDGLAAIISKLDNLGRDIKKLKENFHAIQVGCQICEGPHLDKECPLNEEVKQLSKAFPLSSLTSCLGC
ncbi:hypothetical protein Tco_1562965 [Tanacetum coccineum]